MKKLKYFVSTDPVDKSGVVAWSPSLKPEQVIEAYDHGVFPWPDQQGSVYWFSPLMRGVLNFKDFNWTKTDLKFFRKTNFKFKINADFSLNIRTCAQAKINQGTETWITEDLINTYIDLHHRGLVVSFEVYDHNQLVGGVYGVLSKTYFSAESMFYVKPNASKFALFKASEYLSEKGLSWIDTQVITDFTSQLGAIEIPRLHFLKLIK